MTNLKTKPHIASSLALVICYLVMAYTAFIYHPRWKSHGTEATISWDVSGYYMYLPAIFIYDDLAECKFKDSILEKYGPTPNFQQAFLHEGSGHYVMKYSSGQAIVMSPFFFVGHLWANSSSVYEADGFSFPYQVSLGVGMFLIALIGLFFLRRILKVYFKDSIVATLLLIYVVGTNYLNYSSVDQSMTHNSLFTIYAILVWFTIQFYRRSKSSSVFFIGILIGLATLIRPTEIISALIPLLWGIKNRDDLKQRILFFKSNYAKLIWAIIPSVLIISIQPFYWHSITGDWVVYSYQDQGFSWLAPHIWDYSMSYRCGWLRYCPMMVFPLIGLFFYIKERENRWIIIIFSLLSFYITTAWDVWDYGGTGGRAMVQYYVILAFPLATLIEYVSRQKVLRIIFFCLVFICAYLNIWAIRAGDGNIQVSGATRQYYWTVVGRWSVEQNTKKLLDNKHFFKGKPQKATTLYEHQLNTDSTDYIFVNAAHQFSETYQFPRPQEQYKWIRASTEFTCVLKEWNVWNQCQFILKFCSGDEEVQVNLIRVHRFIDNNETKEIYLDAKVPPQWDNIKILYWNADGQQEIRMKNLKVIGFNK